MKIVSADKVEKKKVAMEGATGAWKQLPLGSIDGVPVFSFRVFTLEPQGHTPYHNHPSEHLNYVIEGEGALVDEAGNFHPLKAGDFAFVSPGEKHQYRNISPDKQFRMICAVPKEYE
jgi:quercetin dioxygenase-like cupin family protein